MHVCPHCRKEVDPCDLEEVFKVPQGCVCEPRDWGDPDNIPAICHGYQPNDEPKPICLICEHEEACHQ